MGSGTFVKQSTRPQAASKKKANLAGIDIILFVTMIAITGFGLLMVFSASTDYSVVVLGENPNYLFLRQVLWLVLGSGFAVTLALVDYHIWQKFAIYLIIGIILLLIFVLFSNDLKNGAIRTFLNGSIQPSEFAKLAIIIYLSVWLYNKKDTLHVFEMGLLPLAIILGVVSGLILLQPDLSAAITIILLGVLLFFLANGDIKQIGLMLLLALVCIGILLLISPTGHARFTSYLSFIKDPSNAQGQLRRSLGAIVNGKLFGVGLGRSNAKLTGLEVAPTDSIFAVIVEEVGLLGAIGLISLYGFILWRGIKIAFRAPDMFGSLLAAGLTFWIVLEAAINMACIVGLLPLAGSALPFVSAGGSNLISLLAAIGIIMNVSRQAVSKPQSVERRSYSASVDWRGRDRRRRISRPRRTASNEQ